MNADQERVEAALLGYLPACRPDDVVSPSNLRRVGEAALFGTVITLRSSRGRPRKAIGVLLAVLQRGERRRRISA